jgi:hypothetical protein
MTTAFQAKAKLLQTLVCTMIVIAIDIVTVPSNDHNDQHVFKIPLTGSPRRQTVENPTGGTV